MKLLIKFPDQSKSFSCGVEFGRLLGKIERGDEFIQNNGFPITIENIAILKDTCKQFGYIAVFGETYYNEWVDFLGIKKITNNEN